MKNRLTPQQKKAFAYEKDHFNPSEFPHAFRREWPLKKALARRRYRHKVHTALTHIVISQSNGEAESELVADIKFKRPQKWEVMFTREWLMSKGRRRALNVLRKQMLSPYERDMNGDRTVAWVESLPKDPSWFSLSLVSTVKILLTTQSSQTNVTSPSFGENYKRNWFPNFLKHHPECRKQLLEWLIYMQARLQESGYLAEEI